MNSTELSEKLFELVNSENLNELTEFCQQHNVAGSVINSTNGKKETPLHIAAGKLNVDLVRIVLEFGADPNSRDSSGRTPALTLLYKLRECSCESCQRRAVRCINILGEYGADMNLEDGNGETPLHLSADAQWPDCATALLHNKAVVGMFGRKAMLTILLERIPGIITSVFDRSIDLDCGKIHDADFEMTFDLGVILPSQTMMCCHPNNGTNVNGKKQSTGSGQSEYEKSKSAVPRREMEFLLDLVKSAEGTVPTLYTTILYHPLIHVFTDIKWKRLQIFYALHLAVQSVSLTAYTLFLFLLTYYDCPYLEKVEPGNATQNMTRKNISLDGGFFSVLGKVGEINVFLEIKSPCQISLMTTIVAGFVLLCTLYTISVEMKQMLLGFKSYLRDILNYFQWLCIGAILATICVALDSKSRLYFWVYPVAGCGMAMSWCQIFIQIGRLPLLSIYVDMFVKVTLRFCWSLLIYSGILIAFALSYCILFPLEPKFVDIPLALVRVLTMMTGELDYSGLFSGVNKSPITSHLWYVAFVILVTLILMNLLVGMAVNDIQRCRKNAEIYVIKRRIRYLWFLEKSFYIGSLFTPNPVKAYLRKEISVLHKNTEQSAYLNKKRSDALVNGCYRIRPNDPCNNTLTRETRYCIKQWLERRECEKKDGNCKRRQKLEKITSEGKHGKGQDDDVNASANVQKVKSNVTSPKLSWHSGNENEQESRILQFNMTRIMRRLDDLDTRIDSFLKRMEMTGRNHAN